MFQSTRPRGARHARIAYNLPIFRFNPRARAGRDDFDLSFYPAEIVSIHAPARGATVIQAANSPSQRVSIHAPARGATINWGKNTRIIYVSIHAPARGATRQENLIETHGMFQSTRPRGARLLGRKQSFRHLSVSIHAPARGATLLEAAAGVESTFQSTRPRGARLYGKQFFVNPELFQSTRPRGARPDISIRIIDQLTVSIHAPARGATAVTLAARPITMSFNPRARAGRDCCVTQLDCFRCVSIHAPARGATSVLVWNVLDNRVSIHAPARGATLRRPQLRTPYRVSIHAPARGATLGPFRMSPVIEFQSTRPRGARRRERRPKQWQ